MPMNRGANARILINNTAYAVNRWNVSSRSTGLNVSSTEGITGNEPLQAAAPGYTSKIADIHDLAITLTQASFDDTTNPFAAPITLRDGAYFAIELYPAGLAGVKWLMPNCLCTSVSSNGSVPGAQPVDCTMESDGAYALPSA